MIEGKEEKFERVIVGRRVAYVKDEDTLVMADRPEIEVKIEAIIADRYHKYIIMKHKNGAQDIKKFERWNHQEDKEYSRLIKKHHITIDDHITAVMEMIMTTMRSQETHALYLYNRYKDKKWELIKTNDKCGVEDWVEVGRMKYDEYQKIKSLESNEYREMQKKGYVYVYRCGEDKIVVNDRYLEGMYYGYKEYGGTPTPGEPTTDYKVDVIINDVPLEEIEEARVSDEILELCMDEEGKVKCLLEEWWRRRIEYYNEGERNVDGLKYRQLVREREKIGYRNVWKWRLQENYLPVDKKYVKKIPIKFVEVPYVCLSPEIPYSDNYEDGEKKVIYTFEEPANRKYISVLVLDSIEKRLRIRAKDYD